MVDTCGECRYFDDWGFGHKRRHREWGTCPFDYEDKEGHPIRIPFPIRRSRDRECVRPTKFQKKIQSHSPQNVGRDD